jgi:hypothetical protein
MTQIEVEDDIAPIVKAFAETLRERLMAAASPNNFAAERPEEMPHQEAAAYIGVSSNALRHARRGGFFEIPGEARRVGRVWLYKTSALEAWQPAAQRHGRRR